MPTGSKHMYVINMYTNIPKYRVNLIIVYMTPSYFHWITNTNCMEIYIKAQKLSFKTNIGNFVCKIAAMLFRPECAETINSIQH